MAYTVENFRTKRALREAVERGEKVGVYQPGPFGGDGLLKDQRVTLEGPHYPEPHKWYASGTTDADGHLVTVS